MAGSKKHKALGDYPQFVRRQRRTWKVPGAAIGILRGGEPVLADGFGLRSVRRQLPVTADTPFAICSCTKAFTTMVMGMLVDEGKLEWDKPVRDYLPEFALHDHFATERMTPRDLVTHRSGLPRHDAVWHHSDASREELVQRLRYLEPSCDLRVTYQYQNLMYVTAGYLVGRITDSTWEEQVQARILDPLGMSSSYFSVSESRRTDAAARPCVESRKRLVEVPYCNLDAIGPAGAINSTVPDMLRWVQLHLDGGTAGGKRLVSRQTLREIHRPQITMEEDSHPEIQLNCYALGWSTYAYRGHRVFTHGGGIDGFACFTAFLPEEGIGAVVLTNRPSPLPQILTWNAVDRLLGLEPVPWSRRSRAAVRKESAQQIERRKSNQRARVRKTRPSHALPAYAGEYTHPGYGTFSVVPRSRALWATFSGSEARLTHHHYDVFAYRPPRWSDSLKLTFATDAAGQVARVSVPFQDGVADIVFERGDR